MFFFNLFLYNSYLNFLGHPKWNEGSHEQRIKNQALRSSALSSPAVEDFEKHEGTHILQSLDGFAIALNSDGRFLYISETMRQANSPAKISSLCIGTGTYIFHSSFFPILVHCDHHPALEKKI